MPRFLLTPRWIAGHVLLVTVVVLFINFGFWQLRRLAEVREHNVLVTERLQAPPEALDVLLSETGGDPDLLAYRRVIVEGRYLGDQQLLTAPRSRSGRPGHEVLTPLQAEQGPAVLVHRGWIPFTGTDPDVPAPQGEVTVTGVLLPPEPGDPGETPLVRRIAPAQLGGRVGTELLPAYLLLQDQQPASGVLTFQPQLPPLDEGNHLSYALQWFAFALIALIGYPALLVRTAREQRADRSRRSIVAA